MHNNIIHVLLNSDLSNQKHREKVFQIVLTLADNALAPHVVKLDWEVVNPVILLDALTHFQEDLSRIKDPNEFKVGGYLCFWIRKLKPFRRISQFNLFTNEYIGILIGLAIVCTQNQVKAIPSPVWSNLLYDLRYRPVSPSVIANQFHLLYI